MNKLHLHLPSNALAIKVLADEDENGRYPVLEQVREQYDISLSGPNMKIGIIAQQTVEYSVGDVVVVRTNAGEIELHNKETNETCLVILQADIACHFSTDDGTPKI